MFFIVPVLMAGFPILYSAFYLNRPTEYGSILATIIFGCWVFGLFRLRDCREILVTREYVQINQTKVPKNHILAAVPKAAFLGCTVLKCIELKLSNPDKYKELRAFWYDRLIYSSEFVIVSGLYHDPEGLRNAICTQYPE